GRLRCYDGGASVPGIARGPLLDSIPESIPPAISPTAPFTPAWERMVKICFKPFEIGKWFTLGLCVFLAHIGGGAGGFNYRVLNFGRGASGPGAGSFPRDVAEWIASHLPFALGVGCGCFGFILLFNVLLLWLQSRGKFMFLDGVVRNRAAVKEPWRE